MYNNTELILLAFKALMEDTKAMVFVKNAELIYVAASAPFVKMVEKNSADEIIGCTDYQIFSDKNLAERYIMDDHKLIRGGHNLIDYTEPITDENGKARYGSTSKYILKNNSGEFIGLLGITRDITKEYEAFQRYQREIKYLFELPKDSYAVSYIDVEDWRIISQRRHDIDNATFQACYSVEELCQAEIESIVDKDSEVVGFYDNFTTDNLKRIYESGRDGITFEYERRMSDNSIRWVFNEVKFIVDAETGNLCVMLTAKDINFAKQKEMELTLAAQMDKMTMLYNHETTMQMIMDVLSEYPAKKHALFMFDVDNFKIINDTMGHQAGDEFLISIAEIIKNSFRQNDVVGRIGGDEFLALMCDVSDIAIIKKKAEDILVKVFDLCRNYEYRHTSVSIGISIYPDNGMDFQELYHNADCAMYKSKNNGKNRFFIIENN